MTIAEEQIKRLAQEAHGFAKEAHAVASVVENKVEQFIAEHLPKIEVAAKEIIDAKSTINASNEIVTALRDGLAEIRNEIGIIKTDFQAFMAKYIPMIEEAFTRITTVNPQPEHVNPTVTVAENPTVTVTAESITETATTATE